MSDNQPTCDYCGFLGWTVERYGRVTHKDRCPHRTDPWHRGDPQTAEWVNALRTEIERLRTDSERLREALERIAHWPYDVQGHDFRDLRDIKDYAAAAAVPEERG